VGQVVSTTHLIDQSASSAGATVGEGDEGGNEQTEEIGESVGIPETGVDEGEQHKVVSTCIGSQSDRIFSQ
jgi:hypothetical protein